MSEPAASDNDIGPTRFSTPVPELDDHRFHAEPCRMEAGTVDVLSSRQIPAQQGPIAVNSPERVDQLHVQDVLREQGSIFRDFEHAVIDDDRSGRDVHPMARRRSSVDPAGARRLGRRASRTQQDIGNPSRESSPSARSSSPPNSVEAFADPRRRERANTLDSHAAPDLETILQRTVSGGTHHRRPTFSNASIARAQLVDGRLDSDEDVGRISYEQQGRIPVIDYEELEEFVVLSKQAGSRRKQSMATSRNETPRVFYDLRPGVVAKHQELDNSTASLECEEKLDGLSSQVMTEKVLVEALQSGNQPTRFSFFSSESQTTVHAAELGGLLFPGDSFRDLFQLGPEGGVWWLDVVNATEAEIEALSRAFSIHPLTSEDIITQEAREKVELFKQYYFVCFRTYQMDKTSEEYLEPVNCYLIVYRDGVLSFSFTENPHAANVRKRISRLRDYVSLSSDWICYAMM